MSKNFMIKKNVFSTKKFYSIKVIMQGKLIAVAYTLKQLSLHYNLGLDAANERNLFRNLANQ